MTIAKFSRPAFVGSFIIGAVILAANLGFQVAFAGRALPGVHFASSSLAGRDFQQIQQVVLTDSAAKPDVEVSLGSQIVYLAPDQISLSPDASGFAQAAIEKPSSWLPILELWLRPTARPLGYSVNDDELAQALAPVIAGQSLPATNAKISLINGQISIIPAKAGLGFNPAQAQAQITHALADGQTATTLSLEPIEPSITPSDLAPLSNHIKALMALDIGLSFGGKNYKPTPAQIGSWLVEVDGPTGPSLTTNNDQIKAYLAMVAKSIDQAPKNKLVNTVNGDVQSTEEGINGIKIDQDSLAASISQALLAGRPLATAIPTQVVAFKTDYNRTYNLDYGKYIEVNLAMQHLWVYQDHQVIMDTPITSGSTGTGHPTVQGLFAVYTKERNRWLDGRPLGYNYDVFVQYWMPFYADYGLHDASWRSSFGGPDYYYGGSHGCVNMPIPAAAWLYNWVDVGTPVFVHS